MGSSAKISRKSCASSKRRRKGSICRSTFAAHRSSGAYGDALLGIPAGSTVTYGALAARIGQPKSVRAVANACAANALALAIPCHRVIRSNGTLSGYCWGVEHKRALIAKEALG
jgi:O-6-methylguanine DNA methyltransferase